MNLVSITGSGFEPARVKSCTKCGATKPLDGFHRQKAGKHGRHSWCKDCANQARRNRVRPDTPEQSRRWNLATRYGVTPERVEQTIAAQGGACAICCGEMKRPVIDHDHATGKVRGILCHPCNLKLHPLESWPHLAAATAYLEAHRCDS